VSTRTLSPVSLFAVTCAAEHVDLTKFQRNQRAEAGENPEEWEDCEANPEICWGLRQSLEHAHGLDRLDEFAAVYRQTVKALAKQSRIPCRGVQ